MPIIQHTGKPFQEFFPQKANFFRPPLHTAGKGPQALSRRPPNAAAQAAKRGRYRAGDRHQRPGERRSHRQKARPLPQQDEKADRPLAPHQKKAVGGYRGDRPPGHVLHKSDHPAGRAEEPQDPEKVIGQAECSAHPRGDPEGEPLRPRVDLDFTHRKRRFHAPPLGRSSV